MDALEGEKSKVTEVVMPTNYFPVSLKSNLGLPLRYAPKGIEQVNPTRGVAGIEWTF